MLNLFLNLKFAEYPCFSVALAGSLHFLTKKYFSLYYLFVCFIINYYYVLKEDSELKLLKTYFNLVCFT